MISGLDVFILDLRSTANTREVSAHLHKVLKSWVKFVTTYKESQSIRDEAMFCREIEYLKGLV